MPAAPAPKKPTLNSTARVEHQFLARAAKAECGRMRAPVQGVGGSLFRTEASNTALDDVASLVIWRNRFSVSALATAPSLLSEALWKRERLRSECCEHRVAVVGGISTPSWK